MPEFLLFAFLSLLLAIVFYGRWRPILSKDSPLDVEEHLPLPWIGHASTVFSLTALFGAYLAIFLFKGLVAVAGLALGSLAGLLLIKSAIERSHVSRYQDFLAERRFSQNASQEEAFWMLVALTQLGYAASEILILIRISDVGLQLGPLPSAVLVVTVATVGYLYCLHGGYIGVFRTDVVQFVAVGTMVLVLGIAAIAASPSLAVAPQALASSSHWNLGLTLHWSARFSIDLLIGFAMGASFLVASPDAWKRMIATIGKGVSPQGALLRMFVAAFVPFLALVPVFLLAGWGGPTLPDPATILVRIGGSELVTALVVVGLVGAFLSSFDSAVITAVHIFVEKKRRAAETQLSELDRFHLLMGLCFLIVVLAALAFTAKVQNAYLLANVLMGSYALIGGVVIGTRFLERPLRSTWPSMVGVLMLATWFLILLQDRQIFYSASEEQIETIPIAVAVLIVSYLCARFATKKEST